jgi:hypothetical protein
MKQPLLIGASVLFGIILSLAIGFGSAFALAGAGHGWCSSAWSVLSILFLPTLFVGFVVNGPKIVKRIALFTVFACLMVDLWILVSTLIIEGLQGLSRLWESASIFVILWILIWFTLHVPIIFLWRRAFSNFE